jgi:P-aminobenzoate N-oxygenase AurF
VMIDRTRPFLPEALTPLFHAPIYRQLTPAQRLRYNQLHGLYVNEQILFFEEALAERVLGALLDASLPAGLDRSLRRFREDERAHSIMFRELNRACAPDRYARRRFRFIQVPAGAWRALAVVGRRPTWFPMLIWLMLMLEERALHYGREILREVSALEPGFAATHGRHLRDERRHVHWDQEVLDWLWPRTSPALRRINAMLFAWLVGEFFSVPRRGAVRVVRELTVECPELASRRLELVGELRALADRRDFHASLYSREIVPRTFGRFDRWREFAGVGRVLRAYAPAEPVR